MHGFLEEIAAHYMTRSVKVIAPDTTKAKAVQFAQCMRENGIAGFPDPDASGQLTVDAVANGSSIDTSSAAFAHAMTACKDLEPDGFTGHTRNAEQQAAALELARCIRSHGVADFPDPALDQPIINTNLIPSTERAGGMAALNSAMKRCAGVGRKALGQ